MTGVDLPSLSLTRRNRRTTLGEPASLTKLNQPLSLLGTRSVEPSCHARMINRIYESWKSDEKALT